MLKPVTAQRGASPGLAGRSNRTSNRLSAGCLSVSKISRTGFVTPGVDNLKISRAVGRSRFQRKPAPPVSARAKDPDAFSAEDNVNVEPPNVLWRVFAAFMYVIPWIDTLTLGREIFHTFPQTIILYLLPSPFVNIYYLNTFMPLIVFFLCFLAIVKNTKLHHFVRFNTMQAIMLDIGVMLFNILRAYFPAEIRWSVLMVLFDKFSFVVCMATIMYGVFFTLRGYYADIPFVSEAVYIQVEASEYYS
mmetsp:Transcript_38166/g.90626  ORF Transcript_38166/g.90626 Transcript_38166/m.90626 type:complete len:247 (-) Transcript_38166:207-947(-)